MADLLQGLSAQGFDLAVAAPAGGDLSKLAADCRMPYFDCRLEGRLSFSTIRSLRKIVQDWQPDIVHAHGSRAASFARLADPLATGRVVYTVHGIHADKGGTSMLKLLLERLLQRRTAHFITVCKSDKARGEALRILIPDKTSVVYNGVEPLDCAYIKNSRADARAALAAELKVLLTDDSTFSSSGNFLLHIGRASVPKDQKALLRAFAEYLEYSKAENTHLLMVVTPDANPLLYRDMIEMADDLCITHRVHWLEPRKNVRDLYLAVDVFVLSSLWEGFPYTVIEAANAACPVIATAVDGIPEAIASPEEGLLVPAGSSQALMDALCQFFDLPESERIAVAKRAKQHVNESFTLEGMIDATVATYETVYSASDMAD